MHVAVCTQACMFHRALHVSQYAPCAWAVCVEHARLGWGPSGVAGVSASAPPRLRACALASVPAAAQPHITQAHKRCNAWTRPRSRRREAHGSAMGAHAPLVYAARRVRCCLSAHSAMVLGSSGSAGLLRMDGLCLTQR